MGAIQREWKAEVKYNKAGNTLMNAEFGHTL